MATDTLLKAVGDAMQKHPEIATYLLGVLYLLDKYIMRYFRRIPDAITKAKSATASNKQLEAECAAYQELHLQELFRTVTGAKLGRVAREELEKLINNGHICHDDIRLAAPYLATCEVAGALRTINGTILVMYGAGLYSILSLAIASIALKYGTLSIISSAWITTFFLLAVLFLRTARQCHVARKIVALVQRPADLPYNSWRFRTIRRIICALQCCISEQSVQNNRTK